jgi:phosphate starvation-inducible protein PhoH
VVDEAQNREPTTLTTIVTRVGEGTKVVFTGDTSQIDAPYLKRLEQRPRRRSAVTQFATPGFESPPALTSHEVPLAVDIWHQVI